MNLPSDDFLPRVLAWAQADARVRALVLVGSRAGSQQADVFADLDFLVFCADRSALLADPDWVPALGPVWICMPDEYPLQDETVFTRLVIYAGGIKVDYALLNLPMAARVSWQAGFRILVDKDGLLAEARQAAPPKPQRPDAQAFSDLVGEFWFEAYHVAKCLYRGELWLAKSRDRLTKELLLTMLEWHAQACSGWKRETYYEGKHMQDWLGAPEWQALHATFAHFDARDSWRALQASMQLFRRLARETAARLALSYPEEVDQNLSGLIQPLLDKEID